MGNDDANRAHLGQSGPGGQIFKPNDPNADRQFAKLVDSINDTVFTLDLHQRHTGIYGAVLRVYHHTPEMYLGKTSAEILGSEAAQIHSEANRRALAGEYLTYEWQTSVEGVTEWFQTSLAPLIDHESTIYGVVGIARNVTPLKKALENYNRLFNASPLPQWIFRLKDLQFMKINEAAIRHYGYSEEEFLSMTILDIRPKEDIPLLLIMIRNRDASETTVQIGTFNHLTKDGTLIQVQVRGHRIEYEGEESVVVVANDITRSEQIFEELNRRNVEIQEVNKRLSQHRLALDQTANIVLTDADGYILEVNESACQLSGYEQGELVGQHTRINKSGLHTEEFYATMWETIRRGDIWRGEIINRRKDGSLYWVDTTIVPLIDNDGTPYQYLAVRFDITERKQAEATLRDLNNELLYKAKALSKSNEQLEQFAFVISHDLQEPIRMIVNFLSLLEKKHSHELDDKAKAYIDYAVNGAKQMRNIILDLLEYSQADDRFLERGQVDLQQIAANVLLIHRRSIERNKAIIRVDPLPTLYSYEYPIETILSNLLDNAIKYRDPNRVPEITIWSTEDDAYWWIHMHDNGIGIHPDYFGKIFMIFQRLHPRGDADGTGVGLALVKKMAEGLGGDIRVESEEGSWTEFAFSIPKSFA